jgi:hypothetical protein
VGDPTLVYDLGPTPTNVVLPGVVGTPAVGSVVTAFRGTWAPQGDADFDYQWLVGGVEVADATDEEYVPAAADLGKTLTVRVTVHRGLRTATATSPPSAPVGPAGSGGPSGPGGPALWAQSPPKVSGSAIVGATLTVDPGRWSLPGATYTYTWRSGQRDVVTTTSPTFVVPDSVYKQPLWLTVVASRPGSEPGTAIVPVTSKVGNGQYAGAAAPRIKGRAKVGATLKAKLDEPDPRPRTTRITWLRDGKVFAGGDRYTLTARDVGHRFSLVVTYGRLHYDKITVVSAPTAKVRR